LMVVFLIIGICISSLLIKTKEKNQVAGRLNFMFKWFMIHL